VTLVYCCQTVEWIRIPLGIEVGLRPGYIALDEDPAPPPKRGTTLPIFDPWLLWPNGWMNQDAIWYGGRPRPRRHCVRWGPSYPPQKRGQHLHFSVNVYFGQTAGWIKRLVGYKIGLGPCEIVLDEDPVPPKKEAQQSPLFGRCLLWPKGFMDQDTTWYGGRPRPAQATLC